MENRKVTVDVEALSRRLDGVRDAVAAAAWEAGRDPAEVITVVVTKFQPVELLQALVDLGVKDLGESRHPEARDKAAALAHRAPAHRTPADRAPADLAPDDSAPDGRAPTWHFIGQLQTNKARQVARYADMIHSVDREGLIDALATAEQRPRVFLQIDLSGTPGRGGADPADAPRLAEHLLAAGFPLAGVMAVAPQDSDPRAAFDRLRSTSDRVRALAPAATAISAGMSGDFAAAIAAGATHLRIGSAITGSRPPAP